MPSAGAGSTGSNLPSAGGAPLAAGGAGGASGGGAGIGGVDASGGSIGVAGSSAGRLPTSGWTEVDATQVQLLSGSPFYDRQELHRTGYVASWDPDQLLYLFRKLAGLPQVNGVTSGYAGWDTTTLKGHITGHFLSAASRMAVATGDSSYVTKVNYLVGELAKVQTALGGGYLAAFAKNDSEVSAPYYVHHKLLAGLVDAYVYLGNQQALDVAEKFAQYFQTSLAATNYAGDSELGAMTDVLTELSQIKNDKTYLTLAAKFEPSAFINPLAQNQDQLNGLHGNMHVAFMVGSARYANVTSDATETAASTNFWSILTLHHSYVNGGDSVHEWLTGPNVEGKDVPYSTTESCNSNNMLKMTARLMERKPSPDLGDYFERTLYNHILATVAPDTGRVTYFTPMHGDFRTYLDGTFCCVGTGLENTARYNEGIYFKSGNQLLVNLYIPSQLSWSEQGLTLQQQGYVPVTNSVTFTVTKAVQPVSATIQFRIPKWVAGAVSISVNGQAQAAGATANSFVPINRTWQTGDTVSLTLPATLRIERAKDVSSMVAVFYGPVLLAGELGSAGMPNDVATSQDAYKSVAPAAVPDIVNASASPADWLTLKDAATLTFASHDAGTASNITFAPLYAVHHQRYSVYWTLRAQ